MENKKLIPIIGLVTIILVIAATLIFFAVRHKNKNQVFLDLDYPITYELKDKGLIIEIDDSMTKKLDWEMEIEDSNIVSVSKKGFQSGKKAKYQISAKAEGLTKVIISKKTSLGSYQYDAVKISVPIYVTNSTTGLAVTLLENPKVYVGPFPMAEDSTNPFLVYPYGNGFAEITFINGVSDWTVTDPNNIVSTYSQNSGANETRMILSTVYNIEQLSSGQSTLNIDSATGTDSVDSTADQTGKSKDPTAGIIQDTTISVSSPSMGITEYIDVHIDVNGNYELSEGKAP